MGAELLEEANGTGAGEGGQPPSLPADHPTAAIYLDESGVIKTDRFFGIGCLRVGSGSALSRAIGAHRQRLGCFDEIHWSHLDKAASLGGNRLDLAIAALDTFFDLDDVSFCCTVADRRDGDLTAKYGNGWNAYEALSVIALDAAVGRHEIVAVMADHVDTPAEVEFEETVSDALNAKRERLAVASLVRLHSHAVDGLQLTDLLLGATMFDFRLGARGEGRYSDGQKASLCRYFLERCGVASFRPGGREVPGKVKVQMRKRRRTRRGRRGGAPR